MTFESGGQRSYLKFKTVVQLAAVAIVTWDEHCPTSDFNMDEHTAPPGTIPKPIDMRITEKRMRIQNEEIAQNGTVE